MAPSSYWRSWTRREMFARRASRPASPLVWASTRSCCRPSSRRSSALPPRTGCPSRCTRRSRLPSAPNENEEKEYQPMSILSAEQKKFYENTLSVTKKEISDLEGQIQDELAKVKERLAAVSYTHLTLPTNREV